MNKTSHTVLFALMIPALATLSACAHDDADDGYTAPAATETAPVADPMPPTDQTMPPADQTMPPEHTGMAAAEMTFADMDANQDGGISMDELTPDQMLHQHFSAADADGNGMLSEAEVDQHHADMEAGNN